MGAQASAVLLAPEKILLIIVIAWLIFLVRILTN